MAETATHPTRKRRASRAERAYYYECAIQAVEATRTFCRQSDSTELKHGADLVSEQMLEGAQWSLDLAVLAIELVRGPVPPAPSTAPAQERT